MFEFGRISNLRPIGGDRPSLTATHSAHHSYRKMFALPPSKLPSSHFESRSSSNSSDMFLPATLFFTVTIVTVQAFQHHWINRNRWSSKKANLQLNAEANDKIETVETARFLDFSTATKIKQQYNTPVYVYDEKSLISQAQKALQFPNLYGLTVRYAMKASPNAAILKLFNSLGVNFDASSGFEVLRAIKAGVKPQQISLSSQELPQDFQQLIELGIEFNACSLKQLEEFGKKNVGGSCGVRFNPGKGSGGTGKTVSSTYYNVCFSDQLRTQ